MRKYLIFLYLVFILFFIFSCSKKKDKINSKSDTYLSNTRYDLIGSFNFKDKIFIKNKSIWLSKSIISKSGKFIYKDDEKEFLKYINDYKNEFRAIFKLDGLITGIKAQNGVKPNFKTYFKSSDYNYEMQIDKSILDCGSISNFSLPINTGVKFEISYKNTSNVLFKKIMQIPILFYDEYKSYPYTQTIDDIDSIKYDYFTKTGEKDKTDTIIFIPGILKPSIKYLELAKQLFYKYDQKVDVLILNLPGIYGSTNNKKYDNMKDLKIWLYKFIKSMSLKMMSFIGIDESSALVQAFTSDIIYMREFIFNSITFINPISPHGLSLYKDDIKKTPYENPLDLLNIGNIKNINQAIKNRDYDFFNKKLLVDNYFNKLKKDKKIDYIKIILSQKGYLNLVYLFLNFNLFGYYYNNNYENIQNSKGYNYTYRKYIDYSHASSYNAKVALSRLDENYLKYAEESRFDLDYNLVEKAPNYMKKFEIPNIPDNLRIHRYKKEVLQPDCFYVYTNKYILENLKTLYDQKSYNMVGFMHLKDLSDINDIIRFTNEHKEYLKNANDYIREPISPNILIRFYIDCIYAIKYDDFSFLKTKWELFKRYDDDLNFDYGLKYESNITKSNIPDFIREFYGMFAYRPYTSDISYITSIRYIPKLLISDYDKTIYPSKANYYEFFTNLVKNNFKTPENEHILKFSNKVMPDYFYPKF